MTVIGISGVYDYLDKLLCLDKLSQKIIMTLFLPFQFDILSFIKEAHNNNLNVYPFEGFRPRKRQQELYNQHKTLAPPGYSLHNYGLAVDIVFKNNKNQWDWDLKHNWNLLGKIGQKYGLIWAGNWKKFKELCHFEKNYGFTIYQLQEIWNNITEPNEIQHLNLFYTELSKKIYS